jgi:hypothetical protein
MARSEAQAMLRVARRDLKLFLQPFAAPGA